MEAKKLVLTNQQFKVLAETIETPKNRGFNQAGQPLQEGVTPDTARKIQKRRNILTKAIQPYLDRWESIVDRWDAEFASTERNPDEFSKEDLEAAASKRNWINNQLQRQLDTLRKTQGTKETSMLLDEDSLDFIIGRFDNRDDITARGEMLDTVVAISDALAVAKKSDGVRLQEVTENSDNGKILELNSLAESRRE